MFIYFYMFSSNLINICKLIYLGNQLGQYINIQAYFITTRSIMINNKQIQQDSKIQAKDIYTNFATVLYRTQNVQVAANYIHLIADQPHKQPQKHKHHFNILHWQGKFTNEKRIFQRFISRSLSLFLLQFRLQNIDHEKCSELFSLSCPTQVKTLLDYYLKKQKLDRQTLKVRRQQSVKVTRQRQQKRKNYLSQIKIAWLSTPLIIAQKNTVLDMLKFLLGQHYFTSTDCNCQINTQNQSHCHCLQQTEQGFQFLYFLAKQIKKNILNYYNNSHFLYKIRQLRKIKEFAQNQLKYEKKVIKKLFQMSLFTLQKYKDLQSLKMEGKTVQNRYYQSQQKKSLQILQRLERQQELKNKKQKIKVKKNKKMIKNAQKVNKTQQDILQFINPAKLTDQTINNIQSFNKLSPNNIIKESLLQQDDSIIKKSKDQIILVVGNQDINDKTGQNQIIKRNSVIMNIIEQESVNQICYVSDTSKIQTNSNTPSNSCLENISHSSDKIDKEAYINGEEYQKQMSLQVQAEKINQSVIGRIIADKMQQIRQELELSYRLKMIVFEQIGKSINAYYPLLHLQIFGSTVTGLALPNSDLDILLNNIFYYIYQEPDLLKNIGKILNKQYWVSDYQCLSTAKVPVIKLEIDLSYFIPQQSLASYQYEDKHKSLKVDITLNSLGACNSGLQSSELMQYILTYGYNLKQTILMLKILLEKYNLHQNYTGGINSYTLFIMVISYVQCFKINICEKQSAYILIKMIQFYAENFDYQQYVIRYDKDNQCFIKFQEYTQKIGNQPLQKSGFLKIIDPVNNKLIKASYCELHQVIHLFKTLNQIIINLRKKTLQVIEMLILQKNRVQNNIILKIAQETVNKSQESSQFLALFF